MRAKALAPWRRVVAIHRAKRRLRASPLDRGAKGTDDAGDRPPCGFGRQGREIDERIFEPRMSGQRAPRGRDQPGDTRIVQGLCEHRLANQSGRADEEQDFHGQGISFSEARVSSARLRFLPAENEGDLVGFGTNPPTAFYLRVGPTLHEGVGPGDAGQDAAK